MKEYSSVILLTDNKNSPLRIAEILVKEGIENKRIIVGENLSYKNERIVIDSPENILKMSDFSMSVVVIEDYEDLGL